MYGHLVLEEGARGRRSVLTAGEVMGMPLLQAQVPAPPGLREKVLHRRLRRAGKRLWEQGVDWALVGPEFPHALWPVLERAGVRQVEVERLCQEAAEPLVMALLARRGADPARAVVCLSGEHALGTVQTTAAALARRVGRLIIDCPRQGTELARWLRREYGLPLVEPGTLRPDVTAAFAPERGGTRAELRLYGRTPDLGGLVLGPAEGALPEGFAPLPLLAALREHGRLRQEEVRVTSLS